MSSIFSTSCFQLMIAAYSRWGAASTHAAMRVELFHVCQQYQYLRWENPSLGGIMAYEQSLPCGLCMPKGRSQYQPSAKVLQGVAFGRRSDGNVWRRENCLRKPELRLEWQSVKDEAASNSAVQLGFLPKRFIVRPREPQLSRAAINPALKWRLFEVNAAT